MPDFGPFSAISWIDWQQIGDRGFKIYRRWRKIFHAGEFLRLLKELDPDEEKFYAEGSEEVEEEIEKLKK